MLQNLYDKYSECSYHYRFHGNCHAETPKLPGISPKNSRFNADKRKRNHETTAPNQWNGCES